MKLYIKQKVFSWNDRFTVMDEAGEPRFYVEGELFSWGKKLHIYDIHGQELAFIHLEVWSFLPRYYISSGGSQIAEVVKEFTFLFPRYRILGPGWDTEGSFMAHDYSITQDGLPVATVNKEWMTWGDSYQLEVFDPANEVLCLAVALIIDCVLASQND